MKALWPTLSVKADVRKNSLTWFCISVCRPCWSSESCLFSAADSWFFLFNLAPNSHCKICIMPGTFLVLFIIHVLCLFWAMRLGTSAQKFLRVWWRGSVSFFLLAKSTYFSSWGAQQKKKKEAGSRLDGAAAVHPPSGHSHTMYEHSDDPHSNFGAGRKKFTPRRMWRERRLSYFSGFFGTFSYTIFIIIARALIRESTLGPIRGSVIGVWRSKCS